MTERGKHLWKVLAFILCVFLTAGCGSLDRDNQLVKKAVGTVEKSKEEVTPLEADNKILDDGVITADQMATIAGKEGTYYFHGETEEGIRYQWAYEGSKIKNPEKQTLKIEFKEKGLEQIQEEAGDAPYALQAKIQKMNLAAPVTLKVTLNEKWDADKVLFCLYKDKKFYQMGTVQISQESQAQGEVTELTVPVSKAGGTFYFLAGSTKGSGENGKEDTVEKQQNGNAPEQTKENADTGGSKQEENGQGDEESQENEESPGTEDSSASHTCTISIECSTILNNWDSLKSSKAEFVPEDGWILYSSEVEFTPGETVFDVLKRVCGETGIHMSSRYTPIYGSYYIEGINQLYEFDCGAQSGWMFRVNGWYPNYGCSSYTVNDGDNIEWKYTCDLGSDVGGGY